VRKKLLVPAICLALAIWLAGTVKAHNVHPGFLEVIELEGGQLDVTWAESDSGYDVLTVTVDYTIPIGLMWISDGCQDLIQASPEDGSISAIWGDTDPVATEESSWGKIKSLHR